MLIKLEYFGKAFEVCVVEVIVGLLESEGVSAILD